MSTEEEPVFHVRSPVGSAFNAASLGAAVGLVVSAVQNSLQKHHSGAMGVFSRTGRTVAMFYAFTANARGKEDGWNGAAGGCAAGLVIGSAARSIPMIGGSCVGLGGLLGTFQAAGNTMLNEKLLKPKPVERLDKENPLLGSTQERRARFFKQPQTEQE
ncbi:hypothetical protein CBS9595_000419 [Malassezia furfur]|nr:hypothetical protein CBS9595_000419 [Malassezia furfur]